MFVLNTNTYYSYNIKKDVPETWKRQKENSNINFVKDNYPEIELLQTSAYEASKRSCLQCTGDWVQAPPIWYILPESREDEANENHAERSSSLTSALCNETKQEPYSSCHHNFIECGDTCIVDTETSSQDVNDNESVGSLYEVHTPAHLPPLYPVSIHAWENDCSRNMDQKECKLMRSLQSNEKRKQSEVEDSNTSLHCNCYQHYYCCCDGSVQVNNCNNENNDENQHNSHATKIVYLEKEIEMLNNQLEEQASLHKLLIQEEIAKVTRRVRADERNAREEFQHALDLLRDENAQLQEERNTKRECKVITSSFSSSLSSVTPKAELSSNNLTKGNSSLETNTINSNNGLYNLTSVAVCTTDMCEISKYWEERLRNAEQRLSSEIALHTLQRNELEHQIHNLEHSLHQLRGELEQLQLENVLLKTKQEQCAHNHVHVSEVEQWRSKAKELERRLLQYVAKQKQIYKTEDNDEYCNNIVSNNNNNNDDDSNKYEKKNNDNDDSNQESICSKQEDLIDENKRLHNKLTLTKRVLHHERERCARLITMYGAQLATLHAQLKHFTRK